METSQLLPAVLQAVAMQLPGILVCLAGCIVVVVRWHVLGSAALPALLGLGFLLLLSAVSPVVWAILPRMMHDRPASAMGSIFTMLGLVQTLFHAAALVLVIMGITLGRSQPPPRSP